MENLKYFLASLFLVLVLFGWYFESEYVYTYYKRHNLLTNEQKSNLLINADLNKWYVKKSTYQVTVIKSNIPFIYSKKDTIRLYTKYYETTCPECE